MAEMKLYELEMLRSRIYHGEQELISTLTPEQFFALLSHDYDTGFAAGKASAQKEILCMLAADGMPVEKIALLLRIKPEKVLEIIATKQAHIEKCRKRLKQEAKPWKTFANTEIVGMTNGKSCPGYLIRARPSKSG